MATKRSWRNVANTRYGVGVVPLAVETYGRWGKEALRWWRLTARFVAAHDPALAHHGRWAASVLLLRWWAILAVALQRDNAATLWAGFAMPRPSWRAGVSELGVGAAGPDLNA